MGTNKSFDKKVCHRKNRKKANLKNIQLGILYVLERALRALASSSGGAACPGGTWGQPQGVPGVNPRGYPGSTPGVDFRSQWVSSRDLSEKKIFLTDERTEGRTDLVVIIVI